VSDDDYRAVWEGLDRRERRALEGAAMRGYRGKTKGDSALMLWWARNELRKGPWPALRVALLVTVVVIAINAVVARERFVEDLRTLAWSPLILLPLIAIAAWTPRRRRLRQAVQNNLSALAGRTLQETPTDEEVERWLQRSTKHAQKRPKR
jgi:hypothetical protein